MGEATEESKYWARNTHELVRQLPHSQWRLDHVRKDSRPLSSLGATF